MKKVREATVLFLEAGAWRAHPQAKSVEGISALIMFEQSIVENGDLSPLVGLKRPIPT